MPIPAVDQVCTTIISTPLKTSVEKKYSRSQSLRCHSEDVDNMMKQKAHSPKFIGNPVNSPQASPVCSGVTGRFAGIGSFRWSLCCLAVLLLANGWGCAGTNKRYVAEKLPAEFLAPPVQNAQIMDLTKLATSTIAQDLIAPGDVIEVSLSAGLAATDTTTFPVRVTDDGIASLPVVGRMELQGMDLQEAESAIALKCIERGLYTSPHVTVTMKRARVHRVTVLGAVEKPATYELRAGQCDVLQAIVAAGGLSEDAGPYVQIRHPGYSHSTRPPRNLIAENPEGQGGIQRTSAEGISEPLPVQTGGGREVRINLASAATENPGALQLEDGGIVMVEKQDPRPIHVLGLVRRPNRYSYPITEELRMLDAIALAGGTDNPLADKVFIIRPNPDGAEPLLIEASISKAKRNGKADLVLAPGDVVSLEHTPQTSIFEALRIVGLGVSGRAF